VRTTEAAGAAVAGTAVAGTAVAGAAVAGAVVGVAVVHAVNRRLTSINMTSNFVRINLFSFFLLTMIEILNLDLVGFIPELMYCF
jgi:hypothetical protein